MEERRFDKRFSDAGRILAHAAAPSLRSTIGSRRRASLARSAFLDLITDRVDQRLSADRGEVRGPAEHGWLLYADGRALVLDVDIVARMKGEEPNTSASVDFPTIRPRSTGGRRLWVCTASTRAIVGRTCCRPESGVGR